MLSQAVSQVVLGRLGDVELPGVDLGDCRPVRLRYVTTVWPEASGTVGLGV